MRWTVGKKLGAIFAALMAVILIISIVGIFSTSRLDQNARLINNQVIPKMQLINKLETNTRDVLSLVQRHILSKDRKFEEKYEQEIEQTIVDVDAILQTYEGKLENAKEKQLYQEVSSTWVEYKGQAKAIVSASAVNQDDEASKLNYQAVITLDKLEDPISILIKQYEKEAADAAKEGHRIYRTVFTTLLLSAIGGLIISILMTSFLRRTIQRPIVTLSEKFEQMAKGDLTVEPAEIRSQDEIGLLGENFNHMLGQLSKLVSSLHNHISTVAATSEELTTSAAETSTASEQIAESISLVSEDASQQMNSARTSHAIVEEIAQGMDQAATSVQHVSELSVSASEYTIAGSKLMEETIGKMGDVRSSTETTSQVVESLNDKSKEISQIVSLITNIADQTNLLALNAAIEAARAGDQGKGFAVVAGEVRNLAEESGKAANHISELIQSIQQEITGVISSMGKSRQLVEEGLSMMKDSGSRFYEISGKVQDVSKEAGEITSITEEINTSTQNVKSMLNDFVKMSENTDDQAQSVAAAVEEQNATMHEMATASERLSSMSEQLRELIDMFKIK